MRYESSSSRILQRSDIRVPAFASAHLNLLYACLLYTSDAADEEDSVDLGGRRIIKKKKKDKRKKKKKSLKKKKKIKN